MAESEPERSDGFTAVRRRFALLLHSLSDGDHLDLMIDLGGALATWQLAVEPAPWDGGCRTFVARRLPDHRRTYLDYEGPVSGDRGKVRRVEQGTCRLWEMTPDRWLAEFDGNRLVGTFALIQEPSDPRRWRFQRVSG